MAAEQQEGQTKHKTAWAHGLATVAKDGSYLDAWYPEPKLGDPSVGPSGRERDDGPSGRERDDSAEMPAALAKAKGNGFTEVKAVTCRIELDKPPADALDGYLRLHLLSHRLVQPHSINVDGLFGALPNVVWTDMGPCAPGELTDLQLKLRSEGRTLRVRSVDRFPRMLDYVVPSGVRIGDGDRVRLGAHLASGTVVMHEGFVNFNAGTLGKSMVEGRISAGVVVGDGSDVGGGASIMGTLSGGGKEVIKVGKGCLIGANAGIGISLGDDCVVEAGCYVTAGTKVKLPDGKSVKASQMSGRAGVLYRRNSLTGAIEAVPRQAKWGELNADLHAND